MTFTVQSAEAARDVLARYQRITQPSVLTIQIRADDGAWRDVTADELDAWPSWPAEIRLEAHEV